MSDTKQNDLISLSIRAADAGTEIFVIDGTFQLAARGVGELETKIKPGLYTIKLQAGSETSEEHIIINPDDDPIVKHMEPLHFTSAAPLGDTSRTHEYQRLNAETGSRGTDINAGEGSAIYVFARDWTGKGGKESQESRLNPARNLELRALDGRTIANLGDAAKKDLGESHPKKQDPWAGCNIQLDPGLYILSLKLPSGDRLEQIAVASAGWQTQIFLLQREYGPNLEDKLADLPGASILLSRYADSADLDGFHAWADESRLVELARLGLVQGRRVLSKDIRSMLSAKFQNPMLGIYGGYLLLRESEPDLQLLEHAVSNLRGLLGEHPDVEALALNLENDHGSYVFKYPPMLRQSWGRILNASVKKPEIVPVGSPAANISGRLWGSDLWLQWLTPSDQDTAFPVPRSATKKRKKDYSAVEKILIDNMPEPPARGAPAADSIPIRGLAAFEMAAIGDSEVEEQADYEETIAQLVQAFGLPRAEIEKMAHELNRRLKGGPM